ncbi:proline dehydrogenase family protein [Pseudomonas mosselii]|uniref:Proline dehydrogenase family protein n=1 Tax=Pseudomonas mosselii TaxID=78327 RepID=A0A1X1P4D6_9PSED|nr:proline dehydrogenase family protein [Pseudomonas mosselii]ATB65503.1 proline dehydrogenase [Pseudomonas mosselii]MBA6067027.1 proline dehydrogenase family protein [Pseudomonas mosselii]MBC3452141.1 proline dehydrogenase family protein [Pseudomonas mosselii]MBC3455865.1 proline dehydrogenase family protein [Pseudomonas mosselii]MDH1100498.1 proline dehydrogenase family protein [Pseudomonas mosselii]
MVSQETCTLAAAALKKLAMNKACREAFNEDSLFFKLFEPAAKRYFLGADREELLPKLQLLAGKGYALSAEYVGEENADPVVVQRFVDEYLASIKPFVGAGLRPQLSFDLSAVGLALSQDTAYRNAATIISAAAEHDIPVMISMEHASSVDRILEVYGELAPEYANVGVTLQAYLHRTLDDLPKVLGHRRKIRLVKGVYNEPQEVALPRGEALDQRYLDMLRLILDAGVPVSCATQDPTMIARILAEPRGSASLELEMLHGVQPALMRQAKEAGLPCRIYAVYGGSWYLHFLHRLAESPQEILGALADFSEPSRVVFGAGY